MKHIGMICICLISVSSLGVVAQESEKSDGDKDKKPATVTARKRPVQIFETVEGTIESTRTMEVIPKVKSWSDLNIGSLIEEGSQVKDGDVVLQFETEKIDDELRKAEFEFRSAQLEMTDKQLAAKQADVNYELDSALNEREMNNARQDFEYYQTVQRPQRFDDLEYDLKSSGWRLEYAQEELDQLMQMYNEDELTEDSERIVLKRAQRSVESAERSLKRNQINTDRQKSTVIPRDDIDRKDQLRRAALAHEKKRVSLPIERDRAQIALQKAEFALEQAERKLKELKADREQLELKAGGEGILYYGRCVKGKWTGAGGTPSRVLEIGKKIPPRKVVMTIIDPSQLAIRAELSAEQLRHMNPGVAGVAVMSTAPDNKLSVQVKKCNRIPSGTGKFDCVFTINDLDNGNNSILPGMNCKVVVQVHESDGSIVVPKSSVFSDDGINHYVYSVDKQRITVETGYTQGDDIEVTGLTEGQEILKDKP